MWFVYNCVFTLVYLLMMPYFLRRMWRRGGYRRGFLQRLGVYDDGIRAWLAAMPPERRIWVHAVSVGEIRVALDFMPELRRLRPEMVFILTTTTSTGHALARSHMDARDLLLYYPVDFPPVTRRVADLLRPRALVLVDGEFWPNLLRELRARRVPVALINGRVSERSFRGYRRLRPWVAPVLAGLDFCGMQTRVDAERLTALGAPLERVAVLGSAKYDVALAVSRAHDGTAVREILRAAGYGDELRFLVGGSTWPGEEAALLTVYKRLREQDPAARLILAPRHMERAVEVGVEIQGAGLRPVLWSELRAGGNMPPARLLADAGPDSVILVNTTGELPEFYALADVIFVGKSLIRHGGQNLVEPAAFGKAVVVGPNMENFAGIMDDLLAADAVMQVADKTGLERGIMRLWREDGLRRQYGNNARQTVATKAGAAAGAAARVDALMR